MIFKAANKKQTPKYDSEREVPVIRSSICTGEKTAGFKNKATGKFRDVMLIRSDADTEEFRREYGVTGEIQKEY